MLRAWKAGNHGCVMGLCDDTVMVGCRVRERFQCVLVHTWDVLPEPMWRRLLKRRQITKWETTEAAAPFTRTMKSAFKESGQGTPGKEQK